jgi:hypothetical protein
MPNDLATLETQRSTLLEETLHMIRNFASLAARLARP